MTHLRKRDLEVVRALHHMKTGWTYQQLAKRAGCSVSQSHTSIKIAVKCSLVYHDPWTGKPCVNRANLEEFTKHGEKYTHL